MRTIGLVSPQRGVHRCTLKIRRVSPDGERMSILRRVGGTSLLTRFGVISLLLTVAVGAVLAAVLSTAIEERARQQAEDAALMAVRLGLQPQITPEDLA